MPFVAQGKTNWKFLLIIVVLTAIVGGLILWFANQEKNETVIPSQVQTTVKSEPNPFSKCDEINDYSPRIDCYWEIAKEKYDTSVCNKEFLFYGFDHCLNELAEKHGDKRLCNKSEELSKRECLFRVAVSSNDLDFCEELKEAGASLDENERLRELCYRAFGIRVGENSNCELCEKITNPIAERYCKLNIIYNSDEPKNYEFCEELEFNIENYAKKYTEEELGYVLYYPKWQNTENIANMITNITEKQLEKGDYLFFSYWSAGGAANAWTSYIFYDESRKECVNYMRSYVSSDGMTYPEELMEELKKVEEKEKNNIQKTIMPPLAHTSTKPTFYTVFGSPVFSLPKRHATGPFIICLDSESFLIIKNESGSFIAKDFTMTITGKDNQGIKDKETKKALIEKIYDIDKEYAFMEHMY